MIANCNIELPYYYEIIFSGYHSNSVTGIPTIDKTTINLDPQTGVYEAKVMEVN